MKIGLLKATRDDYKGELREGGHEEEVEENADDGRGFMISFVRPVGLGGDRITMRLKEAEDSWKQICTPHQ